MLDDRLGRSEKNLLKPMLVDLETRIIETGLVGTSQVELFQTFCEGLLAAGIPLRRAAMASELLHPTLLAHELVFDRGQGVREEWYTRGGFTPEAEEAWRASPFFHIAELGVGEIRRRLAADYRVGEFALLDQLRDEGITDYLALAAGYGSVASIGDSKGVLLSVAIDRSTGFDEREIEGIRWLLPRLALAFKTHALRDLTETLLSTYLGADAAQRVLTGNVTRGRAETIRAVIWYSDLQGFTRLADTLPQDQVLELLNTYADTVVSIVRARHGEVLKFMGDGLMAVFRLDDDGAACRNALDAAEEAQAAFGKLNKARQTAGLPTANLYIGLHLGDVLYGNVGSMERLDFTVLGPAVNEAARIERLCRSLEQPVVVSSAFAEGAGSQRPRLVSLGRYALRGVARPQELYTLDGSRVASRPDELDLEDFDPSI